MKTSTTFHQPFLQLVTHRANPAHWGFRLPRWLVQLRQEKTVAVAGLSLEPGNERFAEDGYYCVSAEQAARERVIDAQTVKLMTTLNR
jgi:hypothetical protein